MKKRLIALFVLASIGLCAPSAPIPSYRVSTNIADTVSRTVVSNIVTRSYIEGLSIGMLNATNIINDITHTSTNATLINKTDGREGNPIVVIDGVSISSNRAGLMTVDDKETLDSHVADTNNPHGVTAKQVGALPLIEDSYGIKDAVTIGDRKGDVGPFSLANGSNLEASGLYSHAEGSDTTASGNGSHAEGYFATASGDYSHAEGFMTTASGYGSHAEGANANTKEQDSYAFAWSGDPGMMPPYESHGSGTFNINPVGGLDGLYIGEQTLASIMENKADKSIISATDNTFSKAVLDVGLNIDDETLQWLKDIGAIAGSTTGKVGIGTLLASILTALMWLKKNKVSNSLLNGRLAYSRNATGLKDRAFNALTFDGTEYNLSTALEAVTPTASGQPRDLLIVATATAVTTISFTAGTIKGDKPTIDGSGTWLITLTEYASGVWYCRQIKMEDVA